MRSLNAVGGRHLSHDSVGRAVEAAVLVFPLREEEEKKYRRERRLYCIGLDREQNAQCGTVQYSTVQYSTVQRLQQGAKWSISLLLPKDIPCTHQL